MKDSIMGKIIYYLFLVIVLLISICLFVFSIGIIPFDDVNLYIGLYYKGNLVLNLITVLVAIFLFISSIKLMFPGKKSKTLSELLSKIQLGV